MKGGIVTDDMLSVLGTQHDSSGTGPAAGISATANGGSDPSSTAGSVSSSDGSGIVLLNPQTEQVMGGNLKALVGLAIFTGIASFILLFLLGWYIRRKIQRRRGTRTDDVELADRNAPKPRKTKKTGGLLASTWGRWRGGVPKKQGKRADPPLPTAEIHPSQAERRPPTASSVYDEE